MVQDQAKTNTNGLGAIGQSLLGIISECDKSGRPEGKKLVKNFDLVRSTVSFNLLSCFITWDLLKKFYSRKRFHCIEKFN